MLEPIAAGELAVGGAPNAGELPVPVVENHVVAEQQAVVEEQAVAEDPDNEPAGDEFDLHARQIDDSDEEAADEEVLVAADPQVDDAAQLENGRGVLFFHVLLKTACTDCQCYI